MQTENISTPSTIAALILAGGEIKPEMAEVSGGVTNRALIDLNGRTMLDYVYAAVRDGLAQAGETGRILIAGQVPTPPGAVAVKGGETLVDTLLSGVEALAPTETRLLVVTADVPFLTPESVSDFVRRASELNADFVFPIVEAQACRARFPEMKRTTLKLAEGEFTGGNITLLSPSFLRLNETLLRQAWSRRKSVTGLAALLGVGLIARLIASRAVPSLLTISHAEAGVTRALGGAKARALQTPYAEIGSDVDKAQDVEIARKMLTQTGFPIQIGGQGN